MDKSNQGDESTVGDIQSVTALKMIDSDLLALVRAANVGAEIGITLLSKGVVISGLLTSGKNYYEDCQKKLSGAGPIGEAIGSYFNAAKTHYEVSEKNVIPLNFLHLKDAVIVAGQNRSAFENSIFRIKIEEIDGFFIGNVTA